MGISHGPITEKWIRRPCHEIDDYMSLFYRPDVGWPGDFIPFYCDGIYHLFYIKDFRDEGKYGRGMPWYHVATRDFLSFQDYGEAIPHGTGEDQDLYVFTGCVVGEGDRFHIFYTGHNPREDGGNPRQAIMHATSDDMISWVKDPEFLIFADESRYEADDWRDPYVFWNEEAREYWMLVAARTRYGPQSRRGCIALLSSGDLENWDILDPFWAPGLYHTHECPDLFRWGNTWYLVTPRLPSVSTPTTGWAPAWRDPGGLPLMTPSTAGPITRRRRRGTGIGAFPAAGTRRRRATWTPGNGNGEGTWWSMRS